MLNELTSIVVLGAKNSSSFWPAVAGAVVGGGVSLATTLLVERQKRKAADETDKRRLRADAQLAARVIALELRDIHSVLKVSLERSPFSWPPTPGFLFPIAAWSEYGSDLAALLPDDEWQEVAAAYSTYGYSNLFGNVNHAAAENLFQQAESALRVLEDWYRSERER
jgi:hypothetical protein